MVEDRLGIGEDGRSPELLHMRPKFEGLVAWGEADSSPKNNPLPPL